MEPNTEPVTGDRVDDVVTRIIAEQMGRGITVADCKPEARLVGDLHADELDHIELAMTLEDEYQIVVDDGDENWPTVADVISYVNRKLHAIAIPRHGAPA
jgi:acyl carrier protein